MRLYLIVLGACCALALSCQGDISSVPPVHLNQNMDFQKKFEMQEENPFFADGRAMRTPVEGTVARGELKLDDHLYRGKQVKVPKTRAALAAAAADPGVKYEDVRTLPAADERGQALVADPAFLGRGQERFKIYCSVCHGLTGEGNGIAVARGFVSPPQLWEKRLIGAPLGHFYDVITNGQGNMPGYAAQIPVRDRWAIATYVRVLQRRRDAPLAQVPPAVAEARGWSKKP